MSSFSRRPNSLRNTIFTLSLRSGRPPRRSQKDKRSRQWGRPLHTGRNSLESQHQCNGRDRLPGRRKPAPVLPISRHGRGRPPRTAHRACNESRQPEAVHMFYPSSSPSPALKTTTFIISSEQPFVYDKSLFAIRLWPPYPPRCFKQLSPLSYRCFLDKPGLLPLLSRSAASGLCLSLW